MERFGELVRASIRREKGGLYQLIWLVVRVCGVVRYLGADASRLSVAAQTGLPLGSVAAAVAVRDSYQHRVPA